MTCVIFSGPTLSPSKARSLFPEAECRGPAAQGDILQAVQDGANTICLIDGVFERRPAVSHKELLWAIHRGIGVFGASSMGALRAVELARFGMVGFGTIFADFRDGKFEDDDEVTVAHAGAEAEYRVGSDAMVNIRATLARAHQEGVIRDSTRTDLLALAKQTFYPNRHLLLLVRARNQQFPSKDLSALDDWLRVRANWVDAKRADAEGLLRHVRDTVVRVSSPVRVAASWSFPHTAAFEELVLDQRIESERAQAAPASGVKSGSADAVAPDEFALIVEELQLAGQSTFSSIMLAASWRATALALHRAQAVATNARSTQTGSPTDSEDAIIARLRHQTSEAIKAQVPSVLHAQGELAHVLQRVRAKRAALAAGEPPVPTDDPIAWYFESRLKRPVPDNLNDYAASIGLDSVRSLREVITRERRFLRALTKDA